MIRRPARGFTLLEILVVVAMIVLLIAILLPTIARARSKAQRVACQTQLHQLVLAWHQYLDANHGQFPHGRTLSVDFGGKQGTYNQYLVSRPLNRYAGLPPTTPQADIFHCPSDCGGEISSATGQVDSTGSCYDYYGTSYKANRFLVGADLPVSPADPCAPVVQSMNDKILHLTRSQIDGESQLILLGDFGWEDTWNPASSCRMEWHARTAWHNIGFMDGHADFTPIYKGAYVSSRYTVLPIQSLQREAAALQSKR
jgi:prepilin-type N-terminal cleavage/methylation domain-containing protein